MKPTKRSKWHFAGLKATETKRRLAEERGYKWAKPWRDTHMPAAGAEHYVVAQLMFRDMELQGSALQEAARANLGAAATPPPECMRPAHTSTTAPEQFPSEHFHKAEGMR